LLQSAICGNPAITSYYTDIVIFERKAGHFRESDNDAVLEKVDSQGHILGFSVLKVSALSDQSPLSFSLKKRTA